MVATVGSIEVAFAADLRRYEAALRKGEKSTNDFERKAGKSVSGVGAQFVRLGGLAKAGLAGLATGLTVGAITGIVGQLGQVAKGVAQIGDEAKRAGVSAKAFQEWKFVAEQNRIGIDAMVDGLKELNLRADEFVQTGKGSAAEAFQRLGYGAEELKTKLADPSALLLEIIDRLGKFDKASQIRISDELFGGSAGERFVELLDQGEQGIRNTIARAHELGIVLDDDVIKKAAEIDRRFNEISQTVGATLKSAIVSAADSLVDFINTFRSFENQRSSALQDQVNEIIRERAGLVEELKKLQTGSDLSDTAKDLGFGPATEVAKQQIAEVQAAIDALSAREDEIIGVLTGRSSELLAKPSDRTWAPPTPPPGGFGSSPGRDKAAAAADREAEAVRRLIGELEHELSLIGATDLQRDISTTLRDAGAAATAEQKAQIVGLISALHAEEEAQRQAADAAALYRDVTAGALSDLRGALSDGKLEWEELADVALNALDRIIDKILNDLLDALFQVGNASSGGGPFGFLGGMIGEGRTFPGQSCGGAERVDELADGVVPLVQDLGSCIVTSDGYNLNVPADAVDRFAGDERIAVLPLAHRGHEVDRIRPEPIAA